MSIISLPAADPTGPSTPAPAAAEILDRRLARAFFYLAFVVLVLAAGVIHRLSHGDLTAFETAVIFWGLVLLWPIFVLEGVLRLIVCRRPAMRWWQRLAVFLGVCLFPPFRLGARAYVDSGKIWLPGLGWTVVDRHLRTRLERFFSVPMVIVALLVLPFLAMEYFWLESVRAHFGLSLLLDIGTAVIWLAFALEFIVMVSVADDKGRYCLHNWMDLAVVFLPLVDFLPILRLVRLTGLLELQQVSRLGRLYRLRSLLAKVWRTILLLELVERLWGNYRARRLKRLKALLAVREAEITDLHREIAELEGAPVKERRP
jgi:voltage-gated potassium channel